MLDQSHLATLRSVVKKVRQRKAPCVSVCILTHILRFPKKVLLFFDLSNRKEQGRSRGTTCPRGNSGASPGSLGTQGVSSGTGKLTILAHATVVVLHAFGIYGSSRHKKIAVFLLYKGP